MPLITQQQLIVLKHRRLIHRSPGARRQPKHQQSDRRDHPCHEARGAQNRAGRCRSEYRDESGGQETGPKTPRHVPRSRALDEADRTPQASGAAALQLSGRLLKMPSEFTEVMTGVTILGADGAGVPAQGGPGSRGEAGSARSGCRGWRDLGRVARSVFPWRRSPRSRRWRASCRASRASRSRAGRAGSQRRPASSSLGAGPSRPLAGTATARGASRPAAATTHSNVSHVAVAGHADPDHLARQLGLVLNAPDKTLGGQKHAEHGQRLELLGRGAAAPMEEPHADRRPPQRSRRSSGAWWMVQSACRRP